jgi:hypothetical protein
MKVRIHSVRIPAMSTIGFLEGENEEGKIVTLALDHRPARYVAEDMERGEVVEIEPEPWQVISIEEIEDVKDSV